MSRRLPRYSLCLSIGAVVVVTGAWLAQAGVLAPPAGAVTGTMKTLVEVEPRTAANATNTPGDADSTFKITQAGSYYLVGNLTGESGKHGIEIAADDVTLDLRGFALVGVIGSLDGLSTPVQQRNLAIINGAIRNWGGDGLDAGNSINVNANGLRTSNNGGDGIRGGFSCIIQSCAAFSNAQDGIEAGDNGLVVDCTARSNNAFGIIVSVSGVARGCTATFNGQHGISAGGGTVSHCDARGNTQNGINLIGGAAIACTAQTNAIGIRGSFGTVIRQCSAASNSSAGIEVETACYVADNNCYANASQAQFDGSNIHVTSVQNRIEGNLVTDSDRGIDVDAANNLIIRNTARGNTTNYDIVANNKVGAIVSAPNSGAISGSTGGAGVGTSDPWANLSF